MQEFRHNGKLLAIKHEGYFKQGVDFITADGESLQVGTWNHPVDKVLDAHLHEHNPRTVKHTQEFVFVYEGRMQIDLYGFGKEILESFELEEGQFAVLLLGGHGYKMLVDTKVIEVKSGNFNYDDKIKINES